MLILVGLGNIGAKYAANRHNVGFMAMNAIADRHGFQPWKSRFQSMVAEGRLGSEKVLLMKPSTMMNLSGQAVGEAMRYYKMAPDDVTVFHDEIDLAPGKCRAKSGGGHAGHNGLRSIHDHIGATYHRIRIGVGHPGRKEAVPGFVLKDFSKADQDWLGPLIDGIADGAPHLASGDTGRFMNAVSLQVAPPRSSDKVTKPKAAKAKADAPAPKETVEEPKSKLQQLMDKFAR